MSNGNTVFVIIGLLCILALVPFIGIWSLNTLFGLSIAYTLKNWFAFLLLTALFGSDSNRRKS